MRQRCYNQNCHDYRWYGDKGVSVCAEWDDYQKFQDWALSSGYNEGLTIDRIDSNGDYEPDNCRWISIVDQQNNKNNNRLITYNGETMSITDWSRRTGISRAVIANRLYHNWTPEEIFTTPLRSKARLKKRKESIIESHEAGFDAASGTKSDV